MTYPRNIRFSQRLKDLEKTPEQYFNVEASDEKGKEFAQAVFLRFYNSEIGIEELELFDMRMRATFGRNVEQFKMILSARQQSLNAGGDIEVVEYRGSDKMTHGHVVTATTGSEVYTEVSEVRQDTTNSGDDVTTYGKTEQRNRKGAEYFNKLQSVAAADVHHEFTKIFENYFMEVL